MFWARTCLNHYCNLTKPVRIEPLTLAVFVAHLLPGELKKTVTLTINVTNGNSSTLPKD